MDDSGEVHWVRPIGPTRQLGSLEYLPVPSTDSYVFSIDVFWVLPGPLDRDRLKQAIAYGLRDYGHSAGRLVYDAEQSKWRIDLSENRGVRVTFLTTRARGIDIETNDIERHPGVVDPPETYPPDNEILASLPLVKFKIVYWEKTGETSFHIRFCHAVGDGDFISRFINAISDHYQNLPAPVAPTFEKYLMTIPTFESRELDDLRPFLHWYDFSYPMDDFAPLFLKSTTATCRMDVRLSPKQIDAIHSLAKKSSNGWISAQDSVSAFLTHLIRLVSPTHIRHVFQVLNFRGIPAAKGSAFVPPPVTSVGNCILNVSVNKDDLSKEPEPTFGFLAEMIRHSLVRTRDPETLPKLLAAATETFDKSLENNLMIYPPPDNSVMLNNFARGSWHSQHFGYVGRAKFYHCNSCENMFHIWPANPVRLRDGRWQSRKGGLDVQFRIKEVMKPAFLETLTTYLRMMEEGDTGQERSRL